MALSPRQRQIALGGALVLTLALVLWMSRTPDEAPSGTPGSGAPARSATPSASTPPALAPPAGEPIASLKLGRGESPAGPGEIRDLFGEQRWVKPPSSTDSGPPQAPPLPFTYLGKLIDQGRVTLYLADAERNLVVHQGEVINGTYRVKSISPVAVTFIYIPMNQPQILAIGRDK